MFAIIDTDAQKNLRTSKAKNGKKLKTSSFNSKFNGSCKKKV